MKFVSPRRWLGAGLLKTMLWEGGGDTRFKKMRILVRLQRRNIEDEKSSYERNFLISVRQGKMYSTLRV